MSELTSSAVKKDLSDVLKYFELNSMGIAPHGSLIRLSLIVPMFSISFSVLSVIVVYLSNYGLDGREGGVFRYFMTDGWALVLPTFITALFFSLMAYNNLMLYLSIPLEVKRSSIVITHLKNVVKRMVISFFIALFIFSLLSWVSPWFAVAIPVMQLVFLFVVNIVVSSEINRLGIGLALEKFSTLINKI